MAKYIRIDNDNDYKWLCTVVKNWLNRDPNNTELVVNYVYIKNWETYLSNPVSVKAVFEEAENPEVVLVEADLKKVAPKPPKKITNKKTSKGKKKVTAAKKASKPIVDVDPYKCPDHPTYGAKYRSREDCSKCWNLYKQFHPLEFDKARRQFEASKRLK